MHPSDQPDAALLAEYPSLIPRTRHPDLSSAALAAKNLRILLKNSFPQLTFSIRSEHYSGGSSVRAKAWVFPDSGVSERQRQSMARSAEAIGAWFQRGTFDGMDDSYKPCTDPRARAFLDAFGGARHVFVEIFPAPDHAIAARNAQRLERTLPAVKRSTRRPRM